MISDLIPVMKQTAELAGFEVVGRITLRDKGTGKEYKRRITYRGKAPGGNRKINTIGIIREIPS